MQLYSTEDTERRGESDIRVVKVKVRTTGLFVCFHFFLLCWTVPCRVGGGDIFSRMRGDKRKGGGDFLALSFFLSGLFHFK